MEFEENFVLNCASLIATIISIVIAAVVIISKLRWRWPINANCWFCNGYTKIWRSESDWWRCKSCQQYNGFSEDGDYNYDIAEQRYKSLNDSSIYAASYKAGESSTNDNTLCEKCNRMETMKVSQMSLIDPSKLSDVDIECYRESLEKQYPLCSRCDLLVKCTLEKQSLWLTQYKMMLFKQRPIELLVNNSNIFRKICHTSLILLSPTVIRQPTLQALPIIGIFLQLSVASMNFKQKYISHLLPATLWLCLCILTPHCDQQLFKLKFTSQWFTLESVTGYQVIIILSTLLVFINLISVNSSATAVTRNVSFKKLSQKASTDTFDKLSRKNEFDNHLREPRHVKTKPPVINVTNLLTSLPCDDRGAVIHEAPFNFEICPSQMAVSSPSLPKSTLDDSLRSLKKLSLSENSRRVSSRNAKIFETRTYGVMSTNLDLFKKNFTSDGYNKKFVLSPPKLKPEITQNSWVAGGYWQMGMDRPTLSRSSSQSSGFGSTGSNFPHSREPSEVNDIDRCSIISDNATLCYEQTSPLIGQENSVCHNCHSSNDSIKNTEKTYINHPTTIYSTSVWMSALLWGSLMFNAIILSTVLYR